ncbi:MAG TPA: endolytic transglycosylase MltG [Armatimonadota bacterium]|nr:endolytic transglycosylase MltG [Armatimonadota bacterium]HOM71697.1 endolytic transglycosylase MltG [Armatimonadota bacterium]HPP75172.1 endolytic transglycosylase MltG [Armatimonadota bacterium]
MKTILDYIREGRNYIITLVVFLLVILIGIFYVGSPVGGDTQAVLVIVPKGATASSVASILKKNDLIHSAMAFTVIARATGEAGNIKPGAYSLTRQMSTRQMLYKMVEGDVAAIWVTIPEGFTVRQIAERLAGKNLVDKDEFLAAANRCEEFSQIVPVAGECLEGYLYPDSYLVPVNAEPQQIISQMLSTFKSKVADPYAADIARYASDNTPQAKAEAMHKIVTIASMIEREAQVAKDRPLISAVIWNRLRIGMNLDIDATVLYALGEHKNRVLYRDLEVDSPYNTYKNPGLPPGPIANPGIESIKAALHPAKVDYLYYVARPDGSHVFSRTYSEHSARNAAIKRMKDRR